MNRKGKEEYKNQVALAISYSHEIRINSTTPSCAQFQTDSVIQMILLTNRRVSIINLISFFHLYGGKKNKYNQAFNLSSIAPWRRKKWTKR